MKQLSLILNNSYISKKLQKSLKYKNKLDDLNRKINYYNNAISPVNLYIKRFEVVGFLGIIISIIINIFQNSIENFMNYITTIDFYYMILLLLLIFLLIYMYTIEPIREEHKEFEVKELVESDYDRLKNNFEVLRKIQFVFVALNSIK